MVNRVIGLILIVLSIIFVYSGTYEKHYTPDGKVLEKYLKHENIYAITDGLGVEKTAKTYYWFNTTPNIFIIEVFLFVLGLFLILIEQNSIKIVKIMNNKILIYSLALLSLAVFVNSLIFEYSSHRILLPASDVPPVDNNGIVVFYSQGNTHDWAIQYLLLRSSNLLMLFILLWQWMKYSGLRRRDLV